jgi:hypothetical protein
VVLKQWFSHRQRRAAPLNNGSASFDTSRVTVQALLFAHLGKKTLSSTQTGGAFAWPKIVGGDDLTLKLRFTQDQDGQVVLADRTVHAIKCSLGRQQIAPEDGYYQLKLGADAESAGVNTTAAIAYNATAAAVAAALNALTDVALAAKKPFVVSSRADSYFVVAADRTAVTFTCVDNELWPSSKVHIASRDYDEGYGYELRLIQAPVAQVTTFDSIVPSIPTMTQVRAGATNSGVLTTELQQLYVPPENPAGFSFCLTRGYRKTDPIVVGEGDTVENLTELLNALANDTASGFVDVGEEFKVYAAPNGAIIEFAGDMAGTNQDLLGITVIAEAEADTTFTLSTKTPAMATLLRGVNTTTKEIAAVLHLTVWLVDEQDDEVYRPYTWHVPVTLVAPVNMDDLSAAADVNWNNPLSREAYLQHSPSQVATGNRHYLISAFGDGSAVEFTINHNLATRYVLVAVQGNTATGQFLQHGTDYEIEIVSDNALKLIFAVAPTSNQYIGQITSAAHDANFEAHTHAISEITGLETRLAGIEASVAALEASAAAGSVGTRDPAAGATLMEIALPVFVDAYPARESITTLATGIAGITPAELPRDGDLLGAVHDASLTSLPGTFPTASSANKGSVWQNRSAADVTVAGGGGRKSSTLKPGDCVASDGRRMFKVINPSVDLARVFTAGTDDVITLALNGYVNTQKVRVFSTGTLPAGLSADTDYFVIDAAAGSFKLSTSSGGSAVDITDTGTGVHYLHTAPLKSSWYPADFERVLFQEFVPADALLVNRMVEVKFGIEVGLRNKKTPTTQISDKLTTSRWRLLVEIGSASAEDAPATTDANLRGIVWQSTPVLDQTIYLNHNSAQRATFGARVKRTGASTWTVQQALFGTWSASSATCAVSSFFLRARLTQFDTTDIPDAEGLVILMGLDKTITGDTGEIGKLAVK